MTEGPLATYRARQRAHEVDFDPMQEVHERLHVWRRASQGDEDDPLPRLAEHLAQEAWLLCFDEFHVANIVDDVPRMGPEQRNQARRFMTLVDALYEHRVNLVLSAEAPPEALYPEGEGAGEFQRTVSRLVEMQSKDYITTAHAVQIGESA